MGESRYKRTRKVFKFRHDVYAKAWRTEKSKGFFPVCRNRRNPNKCNLQCASCTHPNYEPLTDSVLSSHFEGKHLIGIYQARSKNSTGSLVTDFDNHTSEITVKPFTDTVKYYACAKEIGITVYIERSKSGSGYHAWIFFDNLILIRKARTLGEIIIEKAGLDKSSFDRHFPSQDSMEGKKLGSLIVLPFWGKVKAKDCCVFLNPDNDFKPFSSKNEFYNQIKFVTEDKIDQILQEVQRKGLSSTDSNTIPSKEWVSGVINGVEEGKRNCTATRLAGYYFSQNLSYDEVLSKLNLWNSRNKPPLEQAELNNIINSIHKRDTEKRKILGSFFDGKKFQPMLLVEHITKHSNFFHDGSGFYEYSPKGLWIPTVDQLIKKQMMELLGNKSRTLYINDAISLLESKVYCDVKAHNFNLINLKNGIMDLSSMELKKHDKSFYSKNQLAFDYNPDAPCSRWKQFLKEILPNAPKTRKTLQEFSGYCLLPKITIHKCLILIGGGANGKSVFVNTLMKLIGAANYVALQPHQLKDKFQLGSLKDKLLNVATEIQSTAHLENSIWRQVIAGDPVQADIKYGNPFTFRPIAKHIFSMNKIPIIADDTNAFARRIIVIRFNQTFNAATADTGLEDKLASELEGIFNWALDGLKRVLKNRKIYESPKCRSNKLDLLKTVNPVPSFVGDQCVIHERKIISKTDLYDNFNSWCKESEIRPVSQPKFYAQLMYDYPIIKEVRPKGGKRFFKGIGMKKQED